jgi:hypothetical protein
MQILLHLSESQQLHDAVNDPSLRPSLEVFFNKKRDEILEQLVTAVRKPVRDTMKEARLAGQAESYEEALGEMTRFAEEQLKENCK